MQFLKVVGEKKNKLEIIREISQNLVLAQDNKKKLTTALKVEMEKNRALTDIPIPKGNTAAKILSQVPVSLQSAVSRCLRKYPKLEIQNGGIECACCRDDYNVAGLQVQPPYRISLNSSLEYATHRHMELSQRHLVCSNARNKFRQAADFYRKHVQESEKSARAMTRNVLSVVYFVLKNDLSMNLYESLVELLDACKVLIGNQLHSRHTARAMALAIDELFMKIIVQFRLSSFLKLGMN